MKKQIVTVVLGLVVLTGATVYVATPEQPERYVIHTVQYGETMEGIIKDANQNSDVNYDIRNAVSIAVSKSNKIEGGATSRQLKVGDKVAVPIYRH
nr:MAG TPA: foot protein [Caudoviricetes sp.]